MLNFDSLTKRLVKELRSTAMHFDLYQSISKSISTHNEGMNKSPNFWSLTLNAHLEATRSSLCRLYDQTNRNTLNLQSWLRQFEHNYKTDDDFSSYLEVDELRKDIKSVSLDDDLVHKLFTKHRNNEVAHISSRLVSRGESFWDTYPLTIRMIQTLIDKAEKIINKYSILHNGVSYVILSHNQKMDYEFLLDSVQLAATQQP